MFNYKYFNQIGDDEIFLPDSKNIENNLNYTLNFFVTGKPGTGKSTLIGVLINGLLDNGKGLARTGVFRHKHEILCGKTSSFSHQIL